MTVGELRKVLDGLPDDMPVVRFVGESASWHGMSYYDLANILVEQHEASRFPDGSYGRFAYDCDIHRNNVKVLEIT